MAEIEPSALCRQCLDRRIESGDELRRQGAAGGDERDERRVETHRQVTIADARIEPHRLYPSLPYWGPMRLAHVSFARTFVGPGKNRKHRKPKDARRKAGLLGI